MQRETEQQQQQQQQKLATPALHISYLSSTCANPTMETMGVDVSQKIRSAIKAKLVELGAYVDEELPDYIMVMVANKKTKAQMTEDLSLFLGTNTDKFTTWLHEVLEKLQSVTSESKKKVDSKGTVKEKKFEKKHVEHVAAEAADKVVTIKSEIVEETKQLDAEDNYEEVLAIKADFEADELLAEELQQETNKGNSITTTTTSPTTTTTKRGRRQNIVAPIQRSVASHAGTRTRKLSSSDSSVHGTKRPATPSTQQVITKHRILSSTIQSTTTPHQYHEDDDDSKYRNRTLASIVKISERRPSVPPMLQANKTLILRAMEEAKKSVIAAAQKVPAVKVEPYRSSVVLERKPRRKSRRDEPTEVAVPPQIKNEYDEEPMDVEEEKAEYLQSEILTPLGKGRGNASMEQTELSPSSESRIVQESKEEELFNPEFIVTLDGVNAESLLRMPKTSILRGVRSTDLECVEDLVNPMAVDSDEGPEDDNHSMAVLRTLARNSKVKERCKYWPGCKNGDTCTFHHPSVQCKSFPRCKFGGKCLYIHPNCIFDAVCSRKDCPYTHASKRAVVMQKVSQKSRNPPHGKTVRCKFFPQCTNMDCSYFHPKACRYGLSCKQSACTYSHPQLPSPEKLKWKSRQVLVFEGDNEEKEQKS